MTREQATQAALQSQTRRQIAAGRKFSPLALRLLGVGR
jgi:hypothetical protein